MAEKNPDEFRMSFSGHLEELRRRLIVCILALIAILESTARRKLNQ